MLVFLFLFFDEFNKCNIILYAWFFFLWMYVCMYVTYVFHHQLVLFFFFLQFKLTKTWLAKKYNLNYYGLFVLYKKIVKCVWVLNVSVFVCVCVLLSLSLRAWTRQTDVLTAQTLKFNLKRIMVFFKSLNIDLF